MGLKFIGRNFKIAVTVKGTKGRSSKGSEQAEDQCEDSGGVPFSAHKKGLTAVQSV